MLLFRCEHHRIHCEFFYEVPLLSQMLFTLAKVQWFQTCTNLHLPRRSSLPFV
jgi:hypothetical protein